MSKAKVLFFIEETCPSEKQKELADRIENAETKVVYRNAKFFVKGECLEECDSVVGAVPDEYLKGGCKLWAPFKAEKKVQAKKEETFIPEVSAPVSLTVFSDTLTSTPVWKSNV